MKFSINTHPYTALQSSNNTIPCTLMFAHRYPPLVKKWREFQKKWHSPKTKDWDVYFTTGSMDGCNKAFQLLVEEGDPVMVQSPTYTGILGAVRLYTLCAHSSIVRC